MSQRGGRRRDRTPLPSPAPCSPAGSLDSRFETELGDKENSAPLSTTEATALPSKPMAPADRKLRVHFTEELDLVLLQAAEAEGVHVPGEYGTMEHRWAVVTRDVINAERTRLRDPTWTIGTRALRARLRTLLEEGRVHVRNEVSCPSRPLGMQQAVHCRAARALRCLPLS